MDSLLKYLIENGKINLPEIINEMERKSEDNYIKQHRYNIWQGKNGKWYTYLPDEKKGRVQRERNSEDEIKKIIISYYKEREVNPTIKEVFYTWLGRKISNNEIEESTYTRYEVDFLRCFENFGERKIKNVTAIDIEDFLKSCVHEKNMSRKAYSNIRTLMNGMFKYAKKAGYVTYDIKDVISNIDFSRKEFTSVIHEDIEQVFFASEEADITEYMKNNIDTINLGLLLLFASGMRIGELCALKPSDIDGNIVKIRRCETMYKDRVTGERVYEIKDRPKTDAGIRDIIITDDNLWIIRKLKNLNPFGEFLLQENGERIKSYVFRNRLYLNCKKVNAVRKSPHKIRKTYGSKIYDSNIEESIICGQMGHTDISCLKKHYYYNRLNKQEKTEKLNMVAKL